MIETFPENSDFIQLDTRQNRWAIPYHYEALNSRVENILLNNISIIRNRKILDLGCHYGSFAYGAIMNNARYILGIDSEEELINKGNTLFTSHNVERSCYDFKCGDVIEEMKKLPDNSFDTILCLGIFYYIHDPVNLLKEMNRIADNVIIDTFMAPYAAVVSKDGVEISKYINDELLNTAIVFNPSTKAKKKDYKLQQNYIKEGGYKEISFLTLPTEKAIRQFFRIAGFEYKKLSWDKYIVNKYSWKDFIDQETKRKSHWCDIYHAGIRETFILTK